jgi:Tfp pilus assembly protein PilF
MGYHRIGIVLLLAAVLLSVGPLSGQVPDPTYAPLAKAFDALKLKDYQHAIEGFQQAIALAPDRPGPHLDLAYTLLKIGEAEAGRDQFGEAMRLDPTNDHVALEYAFLCYETNQHVTARRIFERLAKTGNPTAQEAFENVDRPLREGISQWSRAVELQPQDFSAHQELASLAEQRDQLELARTHYDIAWHLRPARRDLLLDLGRVLKQQDRMEAQRVRCAPPIEPVTDSHRTPFCASYSDEAQRVPCAPPVLTGAESRGTPLCATYVEEANASLLAASRGAEPRVAEEARELLPTRYPYVYEFEKALALDPANVELRRELAYLHLAMDHRPEAETQFETVVQSAPDDLLSAAQLGFLLLNRGNDAAAKPLLDRVLAGSDEELADRVRTALHIPQALKRREEQPKAQVLNEAKFLAERSLEKGYLKDALKYLHVAHENDPVDFEVMLKLGWTNNILKDDGEALRWFDLARRSPDEKTAAEASKAYKNLRPALQRFRTTVWVFPMFSTRWNDAFTYAQAKTELRLDHIPLRPYISVRFIGDMRGAVEKGLSLGPQYLSERSMILAAGLATTPWRGLTAWFEAGEAFRYRTTVTEQGRMLPDYRGGVSFGKGLGNLLTNGSHGKFAETNIDGVFVSRFSDDTILYAQSRAGYTLRGTESFKGFHSQMFWNLNVTADLKSQYWANFVETGPGFKFRFEQLPASLLFSVNLLRGVYLINEGNPRRPNYNEVRLSVWYAYTH